jgi:hypothetical protein
MSKFTRSGNNVVRLTIGGAILTGCATALVVFSLVTRDSGPAAATSFSMTPSSFTMRGPDNCPHTANATQADSETVTFTVDPDGNGPILGTPVTSPASDLLGDACDGQPAATRSDEDVDGLDNGADNCPTTANTTQVDADRDGVGAACESLAAPCTPAPSAVCNDATFNSDIDGDTVPNAFLAFGGASVRDNPNLGSRFDLPAPSAMFNRLVSASPLGFSVAQPPIGAVVGHVSFETTVGVFSGSCSIPFPPFYTLLQAYVPETGAAYNTRGDIRVIDGGFDYHQDGAIDASDNTDTWGLPSDFDNSATVPVEAVISGGLDMNGDTALTILDDGTYAGVDIIDGLADMTDNGSVDGSDDGIIRNLGDDITEPLAVGTTDPLAALAADDDGDGLLNHADHYLRYLSTMFDVDKINVDGDTWADGQPKLGEDPVDGWDNDRDGFGEEEASAIPSYRHSGSFQLATTPPTDLILTFPYFSGAELNSKFSTNPVNSNFSNLAQFSTAYGTLAPLVLQDGTAPRSPSFISDECSPFSVRTTLAGISGDNVVTGAFEGGSVRLTNPASGTGLAGGNTHIPFNAAISERDTDDDDLAAGQADDFENQFDSCPLIDNNLDTVADGNNITDTRTSSGPDLDGLDGACDPNNGVTNLNEDGDKSVNGDAWGNALDNCPLMVNQRQYEEDLYLTRGAAAPDGGPETDGIGDACETIYAEFAEEDGASGITCNDGTAEAPIDNGGDGLANHEDTDCHLDRDVMNAAGVLVADGIPDHMQANGHYHSVVVKGAYCVGTDDLNNNGTLTATENLDDDADGWCDGTEGPLGSHPEVKLIRLVTWENGAAGGLVDVECADGVDQDNDGVADDCAALNVDPDGDMDGDGASNWEDLDSDGDNTIAFENGLAGLNTVEIWVGTSPFDACPDTATAQDEVDDKVVPDFNNDRRVNVLDFALWRVYFPDATPLNTPAARRSDLNADGSVNALDFGVWKGYFPINTNYCS